MALVAPSSPPQRRHVSELRCDRRYLAEMLRQVERGLDLDEVRLR